MNVSFEEFERRSISVLNVHKVQTTQQTESVIVTCNIHQKSNCNAIARMVIIQGNRFTNRGSGGIEELQARWNKSPNDDGHDNYSLFSPGFTMKSLITAVLHQGTVGV